MCRCCASPTRTHSSSSSVAPLSTLGSNPGSNRETFIAFATTVETCLEPADGSFTATHQSVSCELLVMARCNHIVFGSKRLSYLPLGRGHLARHPLPFGTFNMHRGPLLILLVKFIRVTCPSNYMKSYSTTHNILTLLNSVSVSLVPSVFNNDLRVLSQRARGRQTSAATSAAHHLSSPAEQSRHHNSTVTHGPRKYPPSMPALCTLLS